jgi:hypothetical protein
MLSVYVKVLGLWNNPALEKTTKRQHSPSREIAGDIMIYACFLIAIAPRVSVPPRLDHLRRRAKSVGENRNTEILSCSDVWSGGETAGNALWVGLWIRIVDHHANRTHTGLAFATSGGHRQTAEATLAPRSAFSWPALPGPFGSIRFQPQSTGGIPLHSGLSSKTGRYSAQNRRFRPSVVLNASEQVGVFSTSFYPVLRRRFGRRL